MFLRVPEGYYDPITDRPKLIELEAVSLPGELLLKRMADGFSAAGRDVTITVEIEGRGKLKCIMSDKPGELL